MTITKSKPDLTIVKEIKAKGKPSIPNPPLPSSLPTGMAKEWKEMITYLHDHGVYKVQSLGIVEAYLLCLLQVRVAQSRFTSDGYFDKDGKLNNAHTLMSKAVVGITNLGKALGIDVDRRVIMSLTEDAKAKDETQPNKKWSIG